MIQPHTQLRSVLLCLILAMTVSCETLESSGLVSYPEVSIERVTLAALDMQQVELAVGLLVSNPNPLGTSFTGFDYLLEVNGQTLVEGVYSESFDVRAQGESSLVVPVKFSFADLRQIMSDLKNEDEFDYRLRTTAHLDIAGLGSLPLSSIQEGRLPNVRIPKMRVVGFKMQNVGFASADLLVTVEVDNPNSFAVTPNGFDYTLDVNGRQWAVGELRNLTRISGGSATRIELPVSLSMAEAGSSLLGIISGKSQDLRYELNGNLRVDTDLSGVQGLEIPLNLEGDMRLN